jgi:uncharacterized protein (TIGR04255 family)
LWSDFRDAFPKIEEHPPIPPITERFGLPDTEKIGIQFEALDKPPTPRLWFVNEDGAQLIQVQKDRFIHNWRKVGDHSTYPRYDLSIKPSYKSEIERFSQFLEREKLGTLAVNQCEITYVNHIAQHGLRELGEVQRVIAPWSGQYSDDFLKQPEDLGFNIRYRMNDDEGKPRGRLHIQLQPGFNRADQKPLLVLTLTARGRPTAEGIPGVFGFMDLGREWIVRGFTSITTKQMHTEVWRRLDAS